ncbi:hypothetical protein QQS21_005232 [Conoideocrella luteorostrata]|uniref:Amine oxidase domain-containing protein n=1 Tax=Conoideocrella luteorostrata TaxID=1105319 RepID=A0AAJ0CU56_9HYPO|nr:hypothetical protein QQS21_005232 [Conoideocrella luteorostrata]
MSKNMYKAHKKWIEEGLGGDQRGDRWSEFAYLKVHLALSGAMSVTFFMELQIPGKPLMEVAADFRKLSLLSLGRTFVLRTKIERIEYSDNRVHLQWKNDYKDADYTGSTFDYAIIAVPFTVVRQWRLPEIDPTMTNAVKNVAYKTACKVALEYSERFWEKFENPIYGSCSTATDIPGIATICYPPYNLNTTGRASIIGTYIVGSLNHEISRIITMSEEEHVQYTLDAVSEIHGEETRNLYTGNYARKCWSLDAFAAGGWADPLPGQHELYIPEYFKVHKNSE